jgi:putative thiamine transport system ATP-binding protein
MSLRIHLSHLTSPTATLLQSLDLEIPSGVIHTVMGPSGSGKSSLLAAISGTLASGLVFEGNIHLNGRPLQALPTEQRGVGLLFQDDLLFAHMTVYENLLFAVPAGPKPERAAAVMQGLMDLEMTAFAHADPATLSAASVPVWR